jgi:hypothetical protein
MIFGLIKGPEHPVAVHMQLAPVPADQVVEVPHPGPAPRASVGSVGGRGASGFLATSCNAHPYTPSRPC